MLRLAEYDKYNVNKQPSSHYTHITQWTTTYDRLYMIIYMYISLYRNSHLHWYWYYLYTVNFIIYYASNNYNLLPCIQTLYNWLIMIIQLLFSFNKINRYDRYMGVFCLGSLYIWTVRISIKSHFNCSVRDGQHIKIQKWYIYKISLMDSR